MNGIYVLTNYTSKMNATGWLLPLSMALGVAIGFIFGSNMVALMFAIMLVLDFITGIVASVKRGESITSTRIRDMWFKWIAYLSVLLVSALLTCISGQPWIHTAALGWVIFSEGVSILENCEVALGKRIPFLGKIKKMLDVLKNNGEQRYEDPTTLNHTLEPGDDTEAPPPQ